MNIAEAKTRWCPLARVSRARNREMGGRPSAGTFCLADECMMWRQTDIGAIDVGYCGLAAHPEHAP